MALKKVPRQHLYDRRGIRAFGFFCVAVAACLAAPAGAAVITVDTTADSDTANGACSLREAVFSANFDTAVDTCTAGSGDDTIIFAPALTGETITLTAESGDLDLGNRNQDFQSPGALDIVGPVEGDAASIVIEADEQGGRVFDVSGGDVRSVLSVLRLANLTVQNGFVQTSQGAAEGGGIRVDNGGNTQLILENVRVTNNTVQSEIGEARGGGVYVDGPFVLVETAISGNAAISDSGDAEGGGLWYSGTQASPGPREIRTSEISDNTATSGGGFRSAGGGIYLASFQGTDVSIINSTISGNTVTSTSTGDGDDAAGGGLYAFGVQVFLNNVTVADNEVNELAFAEGGGLAVAGATIRLANSLVATNRADGGPDCAILSGDFQTGVITSNGFNLIGNADGCNFQSMASDLVGNPDAPIDPQLGALADNGGPTRTHALMASSLAIDNGNSNLAPGSGEGACENVDQRGQPRPVDGNDDGAAVCDIGAFEKAGGNAPPVLNPAIPNQNLALAGDTAVLDLNDFFTDPEGQPLSFTAASSKLEVATVSVSQGGVLTVTAVSPGTTTVTVTASDSTGNLRVARVPVTGSASRSGSASASSGGGCQLATAPAPFDPLLWLLLAAAFAGWRLRLRSQGRVLNQAPD